MRNKKLARILLCLFSAMSVSNFSSADTLIVSAPTAAQKRLIQNIQFEANTQITTAELEKVASNWLNRSCGQEELEDLRLAMTRLYIQHGYINSGALLLPTNIDDLRLGRQRIQIIEGRLSEIQIKGAGDLDLSYLARRLPAINSVLHLPGLQRDYQRLLQDPLFARVQSRIIPGKQAGTAILDLELERAPSFGLQLSIDNYRSPAIGEAGLTLSAWKRNLSGWGDLLEVSTTLSQGAQPLALSWSLPLGADGSYLRTRVDQGNTRIITDSLADIEIESQSSGWELAYIHKFPQTQQAQHELGLAWAQRKNQNSLLGLPFSFGPGEVDGYASINKLQLFHDSRWFASPHAWAMHNALLLGRNSSPVNQTDLELPAQNYRIWQSQLQYLWQVDETRQFSAGLQWQWSPDRLMSMEKYALGGYRSIPGYRENSLVTDKGWQVQSRWQQAFSKSEWQWFVAAQAGYGQNQQQPAHKLASLAAGLKWQSQRWQAEFMYARRLTNAIVPNSNDNWQDRGLHLGISYRLY